MSKVIVFDLPAGAYFGKYRHIGGGRFEYDPKCSGGHFDPTAFNFLVEGKVLPDADWQDKIVARIQDSGDQHSGHRRIAMLELFVGDEKVSVNGPQSDDALLAIKDLVGAADQSLSDWRDAGDIPESAGWYEREAAEGVAFSFWNGSEWMFWSGGNWLSHFGIGADTRIDPASARWRGLSISR